MKWASARGRLLALIERHRGDPELLVERPRLTRDLERATFWEGREKPELADLVSGKIVAFRERDRWIELEYDSFRSPDFGRGEIPARLQHCLTFEERVGIEWRGSDYAPGLGFWFREGTQGRLFIEFSQSHPRMGEPRQQVSLRRFKEGARGLVGSMETVDSRMIPVRSEYRAQFTGLVRSRRVSVEQLLTIHRASFYANAEVTYGCAWSFVYFLLHSTRENRALFDALIDRLAAGETARASTRAVFGDRLDELDRELEAFMRSLDD